MHGTLSLSKWFRLKFSAIKRLWDGRLEAALTVENNSGFAETLATGKHAATGADKLVYETNSSDFVLNSDGWRFGTFAAS